MASHSRKPYNNSCQSVSKETCNNCVNAFCNKFQKPCLDINCSSDNSSCCCKRKNKSSSTSNEALVWGCSGVKPLAKFYDSIPDYCDIYHLPKKDFDTTLDALRATCLKLRTTDISQSESVLECCLIDDKSISSLTSSLKQPKDKKPKKSSRTKERKSPREPQHTLAEEPFCLSTPCNFEKQDYLFDKNRFKSFKEECEREVEAFRQSLMEFERELKRPIHSPCQLKIGQYPPKDNEENQTKINDERKYNAKEGSKSMLNISDSLKKSLSLNDIHEAPLACFASENNKRLLERLHRINDLDVGEKSKEGSFLTSKDEICAKDSQEHLTTNFQSQCKFNKSHRSTKKKKRAKSEENVKIPYSPFGLTDYRLAVLQASPVHPVARPNLAARLRVEVCKQKLKEQRTNCTFYDGTKHFDWEVRKTPAWKSLSAQETHDQTLMLRLATRKAEQELQQRQYDMNLELMRQRVKSAPLLLEGETNFDINFGRSTHNCHEVGSSQNCHSNRSSRQRIRKKNSYSTLRVCPHHKTDLNMSQEMFKSDEPDSRLSNKIQEIKKIYANKSKSLCSANSHQSETSCLKKLKSKSRQKTKAQKYDESHKHYRQHSTIHMESGDELSSADRAYL